MTQQAITPGVLGDWQLSVAEYGDGGDAPTEFTLVRGLTEFTPPQIEKNLEDDGEFDGSPWGSEVATGISWTAEGTVKVPRASLAPDPGQEILRKAGRGVAEEGMVWCKFTKRGSTEGAEVGVADVTFVEQGGPKTDITTAELTLTGRGALGPVDTGGDTGGGGGE